MHSSQRVEAHPSLLFQECLKKAFYKPHHGRISIIHPEQKTKLSFPEQTQIVVLFFQASVGGHGKYTGEIPRGSSHSGYFMIFLRENP